MATLARLQFTVQDSAGNVVPGAHVEIRSEVPGEPLAATKSDRAGATSQINPSDADSDGYFFCYLTNGEYKVRAYTGPSGSPTFEHINRYVQVGPPSIANAMGPETEVTTASYTVGLETFLTIKRVAPTLTEITLPPVADRAALPFAYVDWSSGIVAGTDHEIKFIADGSETVMKAATYSVWSNSANLARGWVYPTEDLDGWIVTVS